MMNQTDQSLNSCHYQSLEVLQHPTPAELGREGKFCRCGFGERECSRSCQYRLLEGHAVANS